jgi:hypothetical protein
MLGCKDQTGQIVQLSLVHTADNLYFQTPADPAMIHHAGAVAQHWRCVVHNNVRSSWLQDENVVR